MSLLHRLIGFREELTLEHQPTPTTPSSRDLREPKLTIVDGRKRLVDASVLDPLTWDDVDAMRRGGAL